MRATWRSTKEVRLNPNTYTIRGVGDIRLLSWIIVFGLASYAKSGRWTKPASVVVDSLNPDIKYKIAKKILTNSGAAPALREKKGYASRSASPYKLFYLAVHKEVSITPEGDRLLRMVYEVLALDDDVREAGLGTRVWRGGSPSDVTATLSYRVDPLSWTRRGGVEVTADGEPSSTGLPLKAVFQPPLLRGEYVCFGFSAHTPKHYAFTREEARERYGDEWVRGVYIREPTYKATIRVRFPPNLGYTKQRARRYINVFGDTLREERPMGATQRLINLNGELRLYLEFPQVGSGYFLCWYPEKRRSRESV